MLLGTAGAGQSGGLSREMFLTVALWLAWQETFAAPTPTAADLNLGVPCELGLHSVLVGIQIAHHATAPDLAAQGGMGLWEELSAM
ncbi:hypothetical protein KIL84_009026, partial [Mauremys mutica]